MADPIAYQVPSPPRLPASLIAVAWIFIAFGVLSAIDIIWSALDRRLSLNIGVFDLFIGLGLLRLKPWARTWALVFLWFELVIFALLCVLVLVARGNLYYTVNGVRTTITSWKGLAVALVVCLAFFGLALWQLIVL